MVDIYQSLPEGVVGAAGAGIIGRMLFGGQAGVIIATMTMVVQKLQEYKRDIAPFLDNIKDVFAGKRDWNTGAYKIGADTPYIDLTEFETLKRQASYYAMQAKESITSSQASAITPATLFDTKQYAAQYESARQAADELKALYSEMTLDPQVYADTQNRLIQDAENYAREQARIYEQMNGDIAMLTMTDYDYQKWTLDQMRGL